MKWWNFWRRWYWKTIKIISNISNYKKMTTSVLNWPSDKRICGWRKYSRANQNYWLGYQIVTKRIPAKTWLMSACVFFIAKSSKQLHWCCSRSEVFRNKTFLKNFAKFTGKQIWESPIFSMLARKQISCNLVRKTPSRVQIT